MIFIFIFVDHVQYLRDDIWIFIFYVLCYLILLSYFFIWFDRAIIRTHYID